LGLFFLKSPPPGVTSVCKPRLGDAEVRVLPVPQTRAGSGAYAPRAATGTRCHLTGENPELPLLPHLWKGNPKTSDSLFLNYERCSTAILRDPRSHLGAQSPGNSGSSWGRQQAWKGEPASNNWCFWQLISLNHLTNRDQVTGVPPLRIAED